jgi:hypothetical protein
MKLLDVLLMARRDFEAKFPGFEAAMDSIPAQEGSRQRTSGQKAHHSNKPPPQTVRELYERDSGSSISLHTSRRVQGRGVSKDHWDHRQLVKDLPEDGSSSLIVINSQGDESVISCDRKDIEREGARAFTGGSI